MSCVVRQGRGCALGLETWDAAKINRMIASRALDSKTVANIAKDARELGMEGGPDPDDFIKRQRELAKAVTAEALPQEAAGG